MKNSVNLNSTEWCDVIFEGKNKSYGAFELRQTSWKRHIIAFGIILVGVIFISFLPMIISTINAATANVYNGGYDETHIVVDINKPEEPPLDIEKPDMPEPPKQEYIKMDKFVPPTITTDDKVNEDEVMKGMGELLEDPNTAIGKFQVDEGSTSETAKRKEFEEAVVGDGTGSGAAKKDEPVVFAEIPPQFPGGNDEMYRFIAENLKYPIVDQEMGTQGRVTIRFVVSKTGEVTDLKLLKGISPTCDKEAMRVIKSMPRWIPGKQNGNPVAVYFTLPVVFKLNNR
ncbi:protein TonB [Dysgonomonas hofstadii]|uniref:Protein TonB n=1 Tax=Dysgonomonas hofstadii TaxID=637886 RepID=A0A840CKL8_9BACT|nr:energy transducer TonB [Dysgonomonas hofstadii]MBB4035711.1 protein TonB [Dysgonomonas hofstadii]